MTFITGQCPTCGAARNAQVIAEHQVIEEPTPEPYDPTYSGDAYRILKCVGCNTVYFQKESLHILSDVMDEYTLSEVDFAELKELGEHEPHRIFYEETNYWPASAAKQDHLDWGKLSDGILINLLKSVYIALEHDLKVLAAIGMRTVFDRASELVGVDPTKSFTKKLDQLYNEGHIGGTERERLEILTDAGSAAAHRGWEPNPQELQVLVSIMEHFVRSFSLKEEAAKLKEGIPSRQKQRTPDDREHSARLIEFPPPTQPPKKSSSSI